MTMIFAIGIIVVLAMARQLAAIKPPVQIAVLRHPVALIQTGLLHTPIVRRQFVSERLRCREMILDEFGGGALHYTNTQLRI